ncbi:P1 family peptidase [Brevibacterium jeotgali]|uniref:L-aminopeptidase/D-esterase n=1 Tax=Brevibacterium jeotgali TaxID=1262550 RepID=A0A2H1L833_9MICO|nr:P1 family peptidase [Brevibacterium jeotgali]TWC03286.1 L-aminopeptidase/D-esterase-like protein [Brevibacterium jeotgali]SMY12945.1 L-aminopeptidase/D-esterase [Brevibacterium jeotgali]
MTASESPLSAPFREPFGSLVPGGSVATVPGVRVGGAQRTDDGWLSGTTVIVPPQGTVTGVDVRGGGPAGHETDVLAPGTHSPGADAVVLTGGSAWGLASVLGVQRGLAADGRGFPAPMLPGAYVPIVPAAAVYDLGRGDGTLLHPDAEMGLAAYRRACPDGGSAVAEAPVRGSVGGGTGAFIGRGLLRGGLGSVCLRTPSGHLVAAIVIANPMGDVIEPSGRLHASGVLARTGAELPDVPSDWIDRALTLDATAANAVTPQRNTTIAAIVTDARLDAAQATRLAQSAQAGLARAIHPSHTLFDGDTVFAMATGGADADIDATSIVGLNCAAADALSLAILDAALTARPHLRDATASGPDAAETDPAQQAPRPAALRELAPDLATAWEVLRTTGT